MCGFLGYLNGHGDERSFEEALRAARHRGPDDQGIWREEHIQFGFNRLSIIDLSPAGHQPMESSNGEWVIVFNGEVYNHKVLRSRFSSYPYKGQSDTESILASIVEVGYDKTIRELQGMFALTAYHRPSRTLYMGRDEAGIKPLFYGRTKDGAFGFASQFDQLVHILGKDRMSLSPEGMREFLQLGFMQAPGTIYEEIRQVFPGEYQVLRNGDLERVIYKRREVNEMTDRHDRSQETLQYFNDLFSQVIHDQLEADVPVATFLSSGVDSPLVNAYAREHKKDLTAYTIGVEGFIHDERPLARKYAEILGIQQVEKTFDPSEIPGIIDDHFRKLGEPFGDYSSLPTYMISREARTENTVMLSGDGGDELFWGYPRWLKYLDHYSLFDQPRWVRRISSGVKRKLGQRVSHGPSMFDGFGEWILHGQSYNDPNWMDGLMPGIELPETTQKLFEFQGGSKKEARNWLRWNEFYSHLQRVLIKVDRMSMAHSLEVRVPFLDPRIIDFSWKLESDFGVGDTMLKPLLRKALWQFIPKDELERKKKGFSVPIGQWMQNELREEVEDLLLGTDILGQEFIDRKIWNAKVREFLSGRTEMEWGIWIMFAWQKWRALQENPKQMDTSFKWG